MNGANMHAWAPTSAAQRPLDWRIRACQAVVAHIVLPVCRAGADRPVTGQRGALGARGQ